jgi:mannitol-specific phosphotransferase system IIBC component
MPLFWTTATTLGKTIEVVILVVVAFVVIDQLMKYAERAKDQRQRKMIARWKIEAVKRDHENRKNRLTELHKDTHKRIDDIM